MKSLADAKKDCFRRIAEQEEKKLEERNRIEAENLDFAMKNIDKILSDSFNNFDERIDEAFDYLHRTNNIQVKNVSFTLWNRVDKAGGWEKASNYIGEKAKEKLESLGYDVKIEKHNTKDRISQACNDTDSCTIVAIISLRL